MFILLRVIIDNVGDPFLRQCSRLRSSSSSSNRKHWAHSSSTSKHYTRI